MVLIELFGAGNIYFKLNFKFHLFIWIVFSGIKKNEEKFYEMTYDAFLMRSYRHVETQNSEV